MARSHAAVIFLSALAAALAAATPAGAAVSCKRVSGGLALKVVVDAKFDAASVRLNGNMIEVLDGPVELPCSGGPPANVTDIDRIKVRDVSGKQTTLIVEDPGSFGPGATTQAGTPARLP